MKLKLLITTLVLATLFSGVVLWRVDRFVYGDRMSWAEAQARTQISSLTQAINGEIQSARRMLNTVSNDSFKREKANWKAFQPYYALALMTSQGGSLGISRMVSKADSPAANWTANELGQYIGFMGKELESKGTVLLRSFKDPQKNRHVAVIFAGGGNAYILIGGGENFQSLIDSQKGSMNAISIIARDGLTISHPTMDYVGNVMSDSTMLKEIRSSGATQGLGSYQQGKQQIFGMYSLVPGTNSYVISTVPIKDLLKGRLSLAWQFVFMALGISLLGAAIYFWQEKKNLASVPQATPQTVAKVQPLSPAPAVAAAAAAPLPTPLPAPLSAPVPPPPPSAPVMAPAITPREVQQEKNEAFRQIASALGQELRSPLASILGFSQMVLSKTQDPEVVQAVESILREARSSRDVLEKLVTFTGDRSAEKAEAKIEGPIMQALKNLEGKISQKGVRVEKDFKDTSPWPMSSGDLTKAFENLFANAIEAMERMQEKTLKISAWEGVDGLHVTITDTGEGIEVENVEKVFDPFFTTRSFAHHVGLGLPVVVGILKEHKGEIKIQSQRGKGTQVEIKFTPSTTKAVASEMLPTLPVMKAPELPRDLPKATAAHREESEAAAVVTKPSKEKLTDVNVDSLLELPEEEPLQFLDGYGFDDPPPTAPLPDVANNRPAKPTVVPPKTTASAIAPPPPMVAPPVAAMSHTGLVIDKPEASMMRVKSTELDSYKVEVRRPGKRT